MGRGFSPAGTWRHPCFTHDVSGRRPTRLPGFSYVGYGRYSLCFCTYRRAPLFVSGQAVAAALTQIERTCRENDFDLLAYCFMPDHVHLLVEAVTADADLRRTVSLMKQRSGYEFQKTFHQHLWQGGYYERVLRNEQATRTIIRYIFENPVRAGLVERYGDYPYLGGKYSPEDV